MGWESGECRVKMGLRLVPVGAIAFIAVLIAGAYASVPTPTYRSYLRRGSPWCGAPGAGSKR
jgi:hypothetical protein